MKKRKLIPTARVRDGSRNKIKNKNKSIIPAQSIKRNRTKNQSNSIEPNRSNDVRFGILNPT